MRLRSLEEVSIRWGDDWDVDNNVNAFADVLNSRACIPGCKGLKRISGLDADMWLDRAMLATQIRLLRALLPSAEELPFVSWSPAPVKCERRI